MSKYDDARALIRAIGDGSPRAILDMAAFINEAEAAEDRAMSDAKTQVRKVPMMCCHVYAEVERDETAASGFKLTGKSTYYFQGNSDGGAEAEIMAPNGAFNIGQTCEIEIEAEWRPGYWDSITSEPLTVDGKALTPPVREHRDAELEVPDEPRH